MYRPYGSFSFEREALPEGHICSNCPGKMVFVPKIYNKKDGWVIDGGWYDSRSELCEKIKSHAKSTPEGKECIKFPCYSCVKAGQACIKGNDTCQRCRITDDLCNQDGQDDRYSVLYSFRRHRRGLSSDDTGIAQRKSELRDESWPVPTEFVAVKLREEFWYSLKSSQSFIEEEEIAAKWTPLQQSDRQIGILQEQYRTSSLEHSRKFAQATKEFAEATDKLAVVTKLLVKLEKRYPEDKDLQDHKKLKNSCIPEEGMPLGLDYLSNKKRKWSKALLSGEKIL